MPNLGRAWLVARFELRELFRSRLIVVVLFCFAAGSAAGSWGFLKTVDAATAATKQLEPVLGSLQTDQFETSQADVASDLLLSLVDDPALRKRVHDMAPLAVFYGFAVLQLVSGLVLVTSGTTHAEDLQSGAARFVLVRCDRPSWAFGKVIAHALLLALGLLVGAFAAAAVSTINSGFDLATLGELALSSSWAWLYGFAFLGIFSGLSLLTRRVGPARLLGIVALAGLWFAHLLVTAESVIAGAPVLGYLAWLFPAQYELWLWSAQPLQFSLAALALVGMGLGALWLGERVFHERDA